MSGILFDSPLTLEAALAEAARHEGNGRARTEAAAREFAPDGRVGLRVFGEADLEAFLAIAWQEIDRTRLLTPPDSARTIGAVARRVRDEFGSFGAIVASLGRPGLDPSWFKTCARIEEAGFDWGQYCPPWLVQATKDEQRYSPSTELYLYEGDHSTAVLALLLITGRLVWRPVTAVVVAGRPG